MPQLPPHASGPHFLVPHCGSHVHCPPLHPCPDGHVPHTPPQPSEPHTLPAQVGVQLPPQAPVEVLHTCPDEQVPQVPPQPSGPQLLPAQLVVQPALHWPLVHA